MPEKEYTITFTATEMAHLQPAIADRLDQLKDIQANIYNNQEVQEAISETNDLLDKINSYSWHGWDEVPDRGKDIQIIDRAGDMDFVTYHPSAHKYLAKNFTGWRYPVGDLGE